MDKGKGGKYLILPPDYKDKTPEGYIALPSSTYAGYALLRSNLKSGSEADIAKAVAYGKRIKFYPLSQAANPPPTMFVDAIDVVFDSTIPYDLRFFQALDRFVQREPWLERDKVMIDQLKTIGIEKGKPSIPTRRRRRSSTTPRRRRMPGSIRKYQDVSFTTPFNEGTHWALPALPRRARRACMTNFADPDAYPVDGRALAIPWRSSAPSILGTGQFYLMTIVDKDGQPFDGGSTYRLTVPPNAPVKLYWSATVYDRATHALIREYAWSSRSSQYAGTAEKCRRLGGYLLRTEGSGRQGVELGSDKRRRKFEVLFRLYGPEKPLFEKTWKLPDIEKIK